MSLRARLLVGMAAIAVVLVTAALVIARTTEDDLLERVDEQLESAQPDFRGHGPQGPQDGGVSSLYVAVLVDGSLRPLYGTNLAGEDFSPPQIRAAQLAGLDEGQRRLLTAPAEGGDRYRVLVRRNSIFGEARTVVLALPLTSVDASVARLVRVGLLVTLAVLGVLGLVTWWVVRLGLRPLKQMAETATAIGAGDLSRRVPEQDPDTEVGQLGGALNAMLGHIESAFDERTRSEARLRQFVADASHELRTPVTTIRGYAELYRAGGLRDPDELASALRRTEQESVRMGSLIEDLLLLARLDQGRPLERSPVDLAALAEDAAQDARAVDPDRPIEARTDGPVVAVGDEGRLRQVAANLVGNALVHTAPGTPIVVRTGAEGERAVLEVVDRGPGMPQEVAARAFERFYRADPARSRHRGGTGLGLAIVQATVNALGGTVSLDSRAGEGTRVRVELPLAPATSEAVHTGL